MRLAILGATGATGAELVKRALSDGHEVVAVVRNPDKVPKDFTDHPKFRSVAGDVFSASSLEEPLRGCDAVFSCLGRLPGTSWPWQTITFYTDSAKHIAKAMEGAGVRRLVVMSSWCTKYDASSPKSIEWAFKPLFIGRHLDDMGRMEDWLATQTATIDFTSVRPAGLVDTPETEMEIKIHAVVLGSGELMGRAVFEAEAGAQWIRTKGGFSAYQISRKDVARFMLRIVYDAAFIGQSVAIGF